MTTPDSPGKFIPLSWRELLLRLRSQLEPLQRIIETTRGRGGFAVTGVTPSLMFAGLGADRSVALQAVINHSIFQHQGDDRNELTQRARYLYVCRFVEFAADLEEQFSEVLTKMRMEEAGVPSPTEESNDRRY